MLNKNIAIDMLEVMEFHQSKQYVKGCRRNFAALAFRIKSNCKFVMEGKSYSAKTNTITLQPPYKEYEQFTEPDDTIIVIHFHVFNCVLNAIEVFEVQDAEKYREFFTDALQIWRAKERGYKNAVTAIFYKILSELQRDGQHTGESKNKFLYEAEQFIKENLGQTTLSVAELAKRANVSETYFRRRFKEQFGMSPKKYIESQRINYAVSLLQTQYYTQQQIAEMCGYSDVKYFRSAFKVQTDVWPSKFRYKF